MVLVFFLLPDQQPIAGDVFDPTELCVNPFRHHGYLTVDAETNTRLFYLLFEADDPDAPLMLWTNGGPGASSMATAFGNGPYNVVGEQLVQKNPYAWTSHFHMLYIDHPAPVGFSVTDRENFPSGPDADEQDAEQVVEALRQFFAGDGQRFADRPFYLGGISYAGHYVPWIASKIMEAGNPFNLQGLLLTSPTIDFHVNAQYLARTNYLVGRYTDHFYENAAQPLTQAIQSFIEQEQFFNAALAFVQLNIGPITPETGFPNVNEPNGSRGHYQGSFNNPYNHDLYPPQEPSTLTLFLNNPNIQHLLDVNKEWVSLRDETVLGFGEVLTRSVAHKYEELLQNHPDFRIHLIQGNVDMINPVIATRQIVKNFNWEGQEELNEQGGTLWFLEPDVAGGFFYHARNLTYVETFYVPHSINSYTPKQAYAAMVHFADNISYNRVVEVPNAYPDCYVIDRPIGHEEDPD